MKKFLLSFIIILLSITTVFAQSDTLTTDSVKTVYVFKIFREIGSTSWIHTQEAFKEAKDANACCILLHLNTYGGEVVFADSIRTKILNSDIPVYVFIDNNAASAGALISIACDSIYMRPGANIGAATVVNQSGEKMPDKYQSYMRSTIRATAEAHGADTIITANDTIIKWKRNPKIAEAMVDERIYIPGVIDTGKVLTFTALEAIKNGFCEGEANSIKDVIENKLHLKSYKIVEYKPSFYDGLKGFLMNPMFQGILILIIMGGIYFELQTPGIGFPLLAAGIAAVLYFSPLYIDGIAENWEILLFIAGLVLVGLEVFVIPGFGIAGISGITLIITGLTLSMLHNDAFDFSGVSFDEFFRALATVMTGFILSVGLGIYLSNKMFTKGPFAKVVLQATEDVKEGFIGVENSLNDLVGKTGLAYTDLRPAGKILIGDEQYDAVAETGYIEKDEKINVVRFAHGQLYVKKNS